MLSSVSKLIPRLLEAKHKGEAGRIGIVGGCEEYTGAPYFSGITSIKQGADLVHIFCEESAATVIKTYSPDLIVHPYINTLKNSQKNGTSAADSVARVRDFLPRLHAVVIGPGLGKDPHVLKTAELIVLEAKKLGIPLVFDADGLSMVQQNLKLLENYGNVFLTPNIIEFERLCTKMEIPYVRGDAANHAEAVQKVVAALGDVTIVLKGSVDVIADKSKLIRCEVSGSLRRCGGQGDVLSGSLATFAAWASIYRKEHKVNELDGISLNILAGYGACTLTKETSKLAFSKLGRSYTASDLIPEIHHSFEALFASHL